MALSLSSSLPSLRAAWRWWTGELAQLAPRRWRRTIAGGRGGLVLALNGDGIAELVQRGGGREERLGRLDVGATKLAEAREILASVRQRRRAAGVILQLPAGAGLSSTMTLPAAAEGNLAQVVAFELDRRTPFKRDEVYHNERVVQRQDGGKRLVVELTVVPRRAVDEALALAGRLGLSLTRIELAGDPAGNFLPPRAQPFAARLPGLASGVLALVAAALLAAAVFIPLQQAHRAQAALLQDLADSKRRAEETQRLQKEIEAEIQEGGFLAARKRQVPSVSEVLLALTHLLPDDTYLSELEVAGGEVRMTGFAASASAILGLIDQSQRFTNAAFRSPVVQDQRSNREQFNIAARVAGEGP
jgi:general secretion pathway protein L